MQAYIITIPNNKISIEAANRCINTSVEYKNEFSIKTYDAVTPDTVQQELRKHKVDWKWPWEGAVTDLQTGLVKQSYPTAVKAKRVSCSLSHLNLWKECIQVRAPILILEHDAMFLRKLDYNDYIKDICEIAEINQLENNLQFFSNVKDDNPLVKDVHKNIKKYTFLKII